MVTSLQVKKGISAPSVRSIPAQWDAEWFRRFVSYYLQNADVRNAIGQGHITIGGTVTTPGVVSDTGTAAPPVTGWGTPTGNAIVNNFPGSTATLAQVAEVVAQIITDLKTFGLYGA